MQVRQICKPLKKALDIQSVSLHAGTSLKHQLDGLAFSLWVFASCTFGWCSLPRFAEDFTVGASECNPFRKKRGSYRFAYLIGIIISN
jgi:hypothetical protein